MLKTRSLLACASFLAVSSASALTLDDVQVWAGTGTNRAAMVIHWSAPEVRNGTTVPNPAAEKTLVWGYRWNGTANGEAMLDAILATDHRLYACVSAGGPFGRSTYALGYDFNNDGNFGIRDGANVVGASSFTNGLYIIAESAADSVRPLDTNDLFWSGWYGPGWETWTESGGNGGFSAAPDRGPNPFWTPVDPTMPWFGPHGSWDYASGPAYTVLKDGSWFGWTVAAGGFNFLDDHDPGTVAYNNHKHAPAHLQIATPTLTLNDIQIWAGTGTNRAAMVIHWSAPEVRNGTTVPNPAAEKTLVWGYRWNGTANGEAMLDAILATDRRLFACVSTVGPFGRSTYALGYDLNNNGIFGVRNGTNVIVASYFTNGLYTLAESAADNVRPLESSDLFWSGWYGPGWETWTESGGNGGSPIAPDRGPNPYWTPGDPTMPWFGSHGGWDYANGPAYTTIKDGSWFGWTVAAGGFNFLDDHDPGTVAYNFHKHAPVNLQIATPASAYATDVIAAQGPFGNSPYNDTNSVLGAPATRIYESLSKPATRVKMLEGIYNFSVFNGVTNKILLTVNEGSQLIARFNQPITDDPAHPYGIDFQVFGNAFYPVVSGGFSSDSANMNNFVLGTGAFTEPTKVSVSPGFTGLPGEDANTPSTWPWYRYETGPYADSAFPTHAYKWNRSGTNWSDETMDFTKPVNPLLSQRFAAGGLSAPDGIDLYDGSGGGTGFDLKESGFSSVRYVKVEGLAGYSGGEIDAFSVVRPMTVGDTLSLSPANLTNSTATLRFQRPGAASRTAAKLTFSALSDLAQVAVTPFDGFTGLAPLPGTALLPVQIGVAPLLGTNAVSFTAQITLEAGPNYSGNGGNLLVLKLAGTNWVPQTFTYNAANQFVILPDVTNAGTYVVTQFVPPAVQVTALTNGFDLRFTPVVGVTYTLQRSTNLTAWIDLPSVTPTNTQPVSLQDLIPPADKAFYRLRLDRP